MNGALPSLRHPESALNQQKGWFESPWSSALPAVLGWRVIALSKVGSWCALLMGYRLGFLRAGKPPTTSRVTASQRPASLHNACSLQEPTNTDLDVEPTVSVVPRHQCLWWGRGGINHQHGAGDSIALKPFECVFRAGPSRSRTWTLFECRRLMPSMASASGGNHGSSNYGRLHS